MNNRNEEFELIAKEFSKRFTLVRKALETMAKELTKVIQLWYDSLPPELVESIQEKLKREARKARARKKYLRIYKRRAHLLKKKRKNNA